MLVGLGLGWIACSGPSPESPKTYTLRSALGVSMDCAVRGVQDRRFALACTGQDLAPTEPRRLRLALIWNPDMDYTKPYVPRVVVEHGPRTDWPREFELGVEAPPDDCKPCREGALGTFVVYDDRDDDGRLTLIPQGGPLSADDVVGVARHHIIYLPQGISVMEQSPYPNVEDCIAQPCELPFDRGSALLGPGAKIQVVAVGPRTGAEMLCENWRTLHAHGTAAPPCVGGKPPEGNGIMCYSGNKYAGRCAWHENPCAPPDCQFCTFADQGRASWMCP